MLPSKPLYLSVNHLDTVGDIPYDRTSVRGNSWVTSGTAIPQPYTDHSVGSVLKELIDCKDLDYENLQESLAADLPKTALRLRYFECLQLGDTKKSPLSFSLLAEAGVIHPSDQISVYGQDGPIVLCEHLLTLNLDYSYRDIVIECFTELAKVDCRLSRITNAVDELVGMKFLAWLKGVYSEDDATRHMRAIPMAAELMDRQLATSDVLPMTFLEREVEWSSLFDIMVDEFQKYDNSFAKLGAPYGASNVQCFIWDRLLQDPVRFAPDGRYFALLIQNKASERWASLFECSFNNSSDMVKIRASQIINLVGQVMVSPPENIPLDARKLIARLLFRYPRFFIYGLVELQTVWPAELAYVAQKNALNLASEVSRTPQRVLEDDIQYYWIEDYTELEQWEDQGAVLTRFIEVQILHTFKLGHSPENMRILDIVFTLLRSKFIWRDDAEFKSDVNLAVKLIRGYQMQWAMEWIGIGQEYNINEFTALDQIYRYYSAVVLKISMKGQLHNLMQIFMVDWNTRFLCKKLNIQRAIVLCLGIVLFYVRYRSIWFLVPNATSRTAYQFEIGHFRVTIGESLSSTSLIPKPWNDSYSSVIANCFGMRPTSEYAKRWDWKRSRVIGCGLIALGSLAVFDCIQWSSWASALAIVFVVSSSTRGQARRMSPKTYEVIASRMLDCTVHTTKMWDYVHKVSREHCPDVKIPSMAHAEGSPNVGRPTRNLDIEVLPQTTIHSSRNQDWTMCSGYNGFRALPMLDLLTSRMKTARDIMFSLRYDTKMGIHWYHATRYFLGQFESPPRRHPMQRRSNHKTCKETRIEYEKFLFGLSTEALVENRALVLTADFLPLYDPIMIKNLFAVRATRNLAEKIYCEFLENLITSLQFNVRDICRMHRTALVISAAITAFFWITVTWITESASEFVAWDNIIGPSPFAKGPQQVLMEGTRGIDALAIRQWFRFVTLTLTPFSLSLSLARFSSDVLVIAIIILNFFMMLSPVVFYVVLSRRRVMINRKFQHLMKGMDGLDMDRHSLFWVTTIAKHIMSVDEIIKTHIDGEFQVMQSWVVLTTLLVPFVREFYNITVGGPGLFLPNLFVLMRVINVVQASSVFALLCMEITVSTSPSMNAMVASMFTETLPAVNIDDESMERCEQMWSVEEVGISNHLKRVLSFLLAVVMIVANMIPLLSLA